MFFTIKRLSFKFSSHLFTSLCSHIFLVLLSFLISISPYKPLKKNYFKTLSKQKSSMYISIVYFIDFHFSVPLLLVHVFPFTQIIIFLIFCLENFNGRYNGPTNPVKFFKLKKFVSKKKCNERL